MNRIVFLIFPLLLSVINSFAQSQEAVQDYIDKYKNLAIEEEIRTGVPAAITLAQGIFESQAGLSDLAIASNNHFGIKCKENWTGATVHHDDDLRDECFRSYPSVEDSYRDHSDFLKSRPNYAALFTLDPANYEAWAYGLKKAGYATNPVYASLLIKKIEDNNLQQYTLIALQKTGVVTEDVAVNKDNTIPLSSASTLNPQPETTPALSEPAIVEYDGNANNYPPGIFAINQTRVTYAVAGTSLFALASNNNIAFQKLLDFNELDNTDILTKSQLIYLESKPKKSNSRDYHTVAAGETIEAIAQQEAVQLASLFEYNKMQKGLEPAPGERVYLKPGRQPYYPKLLPATNTAR